MALEDREPPSPEELARKIVAKFDWCSREYRERGAAGRDPTAMDGFREVARGVVTEHISRCKGFTVKVGVNWLRPSNQMLFEIHALQPMLDWKADAERRAVGLVAERLKERIRELQATYPHLSARIVGWMVAKDVEAESGNGEYASHRFQSEMLLARSLSLPGFRSAVAKKFGHDREGMTVSA